MSKKTQQTDFPIVQFHGQPAGGANQSLHTPPLAGLWYVGEAPAWALSQGIECYGMREFTPAFCRNHNRQCWQLSPTNEPCAAGQQCTCWAYQFVGAETAGTAKRRRISRPPFDLIEAAPPADKE